MRSSLRRFAVAFAVSTGLVVAGVAVPATAAEACAYADARAGQVSNVALGRATHCLVNRERERRGLRRLRGNWRLSSGGSAGPATSARSAGGRSARTSLGGAAAGRHPG